MLPLVNALLLAHVPGYSGECEFSCCHPPHSTRPEVSQAVYFKGSGGIKIDLVDIQDHIDAGKNIEFSLVFKEEYQVDTFDVFVGCGSCDSHRTSDGHHGFDALTYTNLMPKPTTYQPGQLEAFTQTGYFPLLPKGEMRMFNASDLRDCDSHHFSIRLYTYDNASADLTYSIALGCEDGIECEQFTFLELFLFPIYVMRGHGVYWTDAGYTLGLISLIVAIVYLGGLWFFFDRSWLGLYEPVSILQPRRIYETLVGNNKGHRPHFGQLPCVLWQPSLRCVLYALVVYALIVDIFESLVHLSIALTGLGQGSQPFERSGVTMYFGLVLGFGKLLPLLLVSLIWYLHRSVPEFVWRTYNFRFACNKYDGFGRFSPFWAHGAWSLVELWGLGVLGLFWLGAGYYIFPFAMIIAGTYRFCIWIVNPSDYKKGVQFRYPTIDSRLGDLGGVCTDETKWQLVDIYNSYFDRRVLTNDGSARPLVQSGGDSVAFNKALPLGNPMPMMDDDDRDDYNTPVPGFVRATTTTALSVEQIVQLGRR